MADKTAAPDIFHVDQHPVYMDTILKEQLAKYGISLFQAGVQQNQLAEVVNRIMVIRIVESVLDDPKYNSLLKRSLPTSVKKLSL